VRRSFPSLSVRTRLTLWYSGILLAIVVTIGALSYSWLRVGLLQDLDASLLTVAQVVKDTGSAAREAGDHEMLLRELLGPELYDKFFQLLDPEGRPRTSPPARRPYPLALSAAARARAARGQNTAGRGGRRPRRAGRAPSPGSDDADRTADQRGGSQSARGAAPDG